MVYTSLLKVYVYSYTGSGTGSGLHSSSDLGFSSESGLGSDINGEWLQIY